MANRRFTQFFNTLHNRPVLLDCNFAISAADSAGKGITSLKGPGIQSVFMHSSAAFTGTTHTSVSVTGISSTSALVVGMPVQGSGIAAGTTIASIVSATAITLSAATSSSTTGSITYQAIGNPNPPVGYALVQLQDTYNGFFSGFSGFLAPNTGSGLTSTTVNLVYVITVLGTATLAQWQAKGLPIGITPAVGASFIASATGTIGGSAEVQLSTGSGITSVEIVGDPNKTLASSAANVLGVSSGAYVLVKFIGATGSVAGSGLTLTMNSYTPAGTITNGTPDTFAGTPATLTGSIGGTLDGTLVLAAAAPADGSVCSLSFYLSNSRIQVQGE